ncbi:MAG: peptidoglycan-binding protein [Catenulispora sp.]|nr:peptidoglycan-binding protein [Catenulispora sp.]
MIKLGKHTAAVTVLVAATAVLAPVGAASAAATGSHETIAPAGVVTPASYSCGYYSGTVTTKAGQTGTAAQQRIKEVQCLINLGYYSWSTGRPKLAVDGSFGQKTYDAVVWYQECSGILDDGIVGVNTWYQLRNNRYC